MKQQEALNCIYELLADNFIDTGFYPSKKRDEYIKNHYPYKYKIRIHIAPKSFQHIVLSVYHKEIEKNFLVIEKKVTSIGLKSFSLCELTDWKELYNNNDMKIGEIWFCGLKSLEEIKSKKEEYVVALKLATQWFEKCKDLNYAIELNKKNGFTRCLGLALCIGKYLEKDLEQEYELIVKENENKSGFDKNRFKKFYEYLTE